MRLANGTSTYVTPPHGRCPSAAADLSGDPHGFRRLDSRMLGPARSCSHGRPGRSRCARHLEGASRPSAARVKMNALRLRLRRALAKFTPSFASGLLAESMVAFLFETETTGRNRP